MKNALSLFDGLSGLQIASERLGINYENYYASEIDEHAMSVTSLHYPNTKHLGSILNWENWDIDWSTIDIVSGGFPCFTGETLITTDKGLIPIKEIQKGDLVLTHNLQFKSVVLKMIKLAQEYNKIDFHGCNQINATDEHPFYVKEITNRKVSEPHWVEAKDLNENHYVAIAINPTKNKPLFVNENYDFLKIIAMFIYNGYINKDEVIILTDEKNYQTLDSFLKTHHINYSKNIDKLNHTYIIKDAFLLNFFPLFIKGEEKFIPEFIFNYDESIIKIFLEHYIKIQNKSIKERVNLYSRDRLFINQLQQLIQKTYKVHAYIFEAKVGNMIFFNLEFKSNEFEQSFYDGKYIWVRFKSKEKVIEETPVYNIEVEDDNSYVVHGMIVHNCQAWSVAGKQLGDKDERGMLFWTMLDVMKKAKEHNPNVHFLIENVKMKSDFEQYITHHTKEALGEIYKILINSALVSAQNRQRYYWTSFPVSQPEDRGVILHDVIEKYVGKNFHTELHKDHTGGNQLNPHYKSQANTIHDISRKSPTICAGTHGYALGHIPYSGINLEDAYIGEAIKREFNQKTTCHHVGDAVDINGNDSIKRVYADSGKSPTLTTMGGGHREPKVLFLADNNRVKGVSEDERGFRPHQGDDRKSGVSEVSRILKPEALKSDTVIATHAPNILCGAFRGRYNEDGSTSQQLEIREDQKTNSLTTVQKDNVVIMPASIVGRRLNEKGVRDDYNKDIPINQCLQVKHNSNKMGCLTTIEKDTLLSDMPPGRYPNAYNDKTLSYRKLTPLECERLQTIHSINTYLTINISRQEINELIELFKKDKKLTKILNKKENIDYINLFNSLLTFNFEDSKKMFTQQIENFIIFKEDALVKLGAFELETDNSVYGYYKERYLEINKENILELIKFEKNRYSISSKQIEKIIISLYCLNEFLIKKINDFHELLNKENPNSFEEYKIKILFIDGYTASASNTQRYKMIGNGWTIEVIKHILSHIS